MTKSYYIKFLLIFFIAGQALGQKIKYKEVFGLLSTKQYDAAEPFLKTYLADNDDNPNAYLFMGLIYEEKSLADDILKETDIAVQHMDSAVMYFDKAHKGINEKELRRNKEYYISYNRRDLRTGEYGVTLSDVQLDLENRMNALRERIDRVRMVSHYFNESADLYTRSNQLYRRIQKSYPGLLELFLRSDDKLLEDLKTLSLRYDSCSKSFGNYRTSLGGVGKSQYNQNWNPKDIADFKTEGSELVSFYNDNLDVWNYKKFADNARNYIINEVKPIQEKLVERDMEINKLREKLETDSVSILDGITKIEQELKDNTLRKFDPNPLPLDVFELKLAELRYKSILVENIKVRDSLDVAFQLTRATTRMDAANKLDAASQKMLNRNIDAEALNYTGFVNSTYSKIDILKSYVRTLSGYAQREKQASEIQLSIRKKAQQWLTLEHDSIPLFTDNNNTPFKPLIIEEGKYTAGLSYKGTGTEGYFYNIPPSHVPKVKVTFPIDKEHFSKASFPSIKPMVTTDPNGQIFYIIFYREELAGDKYPSTVTKIYKSDGLSWSINIPLDFLPTELYLRTDTGELVIKSENEASVVVDKNGTILKNN